MAREYIPLSVPNLKGNELDYVIDAVKTEWVSSGGSYINDFEAKIAEYVGVEETVVKPRAVKPEQVTARFLSARRKADAKSFKNPSPTESGMFPDK